MAKELDWKSSKAATPRGFESHVLRQRTEVRNHFRFSFLRWNSNGTRTREGIVKLGADLSNLSIVPGPEKNQLIITIPHSEILNSNLPDQADEKMVGQLTNFLTMACPQIEKYSDSKRPAGASADRSFCVILFTVQSSISRAGCSMHKLPQPYRLPV